MTDASRASASGERMAREPRAVERDRELLLASIDLARRAREKGNWPFGAVLAASDGRLLLAAENTVVTERDPTGHAETNLIRAAGRSYEQDFLRTCTLYASTEPCPMCTGALFWSGIGRVVFGLDRDGLLELRSATPGRSPVLEGPFLLEQSREVHRGYW